MITVFFQGGLGNQMFQYAAGRAVAHKLETDLLFDTSWYHYPVKRKFMLGAFGMPGEVVKSPLSFVSNLLFKKPLFELMGGRPVYREKEYAYNPELFDVTDGTTLIGVFQTEKYFKPIRNILLKDFSMDHLSLSEGGGRLLRNIRTSESVAVHVRRGDYLQYPKFNVCTETYYRAGVDYMKNELGDPHFYVFSDDIEWCRKIFNGSAFTFCDEASIDDPLVDMKLMSSCSHHILSNSSFSWWGAWLGTDVQQKVVIPEIWLNCDDDWSDIPCEGWTRLAC